MKLRNKKTGEIRELQDIMSDMIDNHIVPTLIAIENEWEDFEEPAYWFIRDDGGIGVSHLGNNPFSVTVGGSRESIGNVFETREEAEEAVEKLKAWKRLKDRNLRFNLNYQTGGATINHKDVILCRIEAYFDDRWEEDNMKAEEDLDLLLGGEE